MTEICPEIECTGCGVCAGVCPLNCIEIKGDEIGYLHPIIDNKQCINCKLCQKTCPNNREIVFRKPINVYAAWALDERERQSSISGGIAAVLSQYIVKKGGVVYGAVGGKAGYVCHQRVSKLCELYKFKMSKYVQSNINRTVFNQIKSDLKEGKKVMFFGTPCQTAAVRSMFLDNTNLLCVEIICHGVPSQQLLQDHMEMVSGKDCSHITEFTTRDNDGNFLTLKEDQKIVYRLADPEDQYMNAFKRGLFFRTSCYQCHYARPERQADLTIGDFWGLGETTYSHHKVSLILENSFLGSQLIDAIRDNLFLDKRSLEEASHANGQLSHPSHKHPCYNLFKKLYLEKGYPTAINYSLKGYYRKAAIYRFCSKIPGFYRLGLNKFFNI